jgi:hypothetical protein
VTATIVLGVNGTNATATDASWASKQKGTAEQFKVMEKDVKKGVGWVRAWFRCTVVHQEQGAVHNLSPILGAAAAAAAAAFTGILVFWVLGGCFGGNV